MKIMWFTIISGFLVLFSFQNCQKSPAPDELQLYSKNAVLQPAQPSVVNLADQKLSAFQFTGRENEEIIKNGTTFTIVTDKIYHVDLATGKVASESEFTQVQKHYCLTESLKNELSSILKSSSVCATAQPVTANKACTQEVQSGYAKILAEQGQYDLGAATDGCGTNSADLCGDNSNLLKGFISHLKSQLNSISCD